MDATAMPLLHLCRRRACLLRKTLNALVSCSSNPCGALRRSMMAMDQVDAFLVSMEKELDKAEKEGADGRHGD